MAESLEDALLDAGLVLNAPISDNGEIVRLGTKKKPKGDNGWCVLYSGGKAASFGNWEEGSSYFWCEDGANPEEYNSKRNEVREKISKERDTSAGKAAKFVDACDTAGHSDYLLRKKISAHGVRFSGSHIVIPVQDGEGKIWSYQKIGGDGEKRFMSGGKVKGCYYFIASGQTKPDDLVLVCEGFATGAAIHEETGLPVACALSANNLRPVCDALPFSNLLVAADNDESGAGEEAAQNTGRRYVMPNMVGWDFSDMRLAGKAIAPLFKPDEEGGEIAVHGLVGEIANWITSTAVRPQPMLSLAAAISVMGVVKAHRYATPTDLRSNFLCLALAPTASGKEHPQQCAIRLLQAIGMQKHIMGEPVSGVGLLSGLIEADKMGLMVIDEIGRYIANATSPMAGGFQREIMDYIVKSFSKANSFLPGRQYGDSKKNPRIDLENPNLCVLGSTVREKVTDALSGRDVIDGFLNRWLLFEVQKRSATQRDFKFTPPPESLIEALKAMIESPVQYDPYTMMAEVETVHYTPEAADLMREYSSYMQNKVESLSYPLDALYSRNNEHCGKLAMLISDNEVITVQDVKMAIAISRHSIRSMKRFVGEIADNQQELEYNKVRNLVAMHGMISKTDITKRTQFILGGARRREEIIQSLLDSDFMVEMPQPSGRGRKSVIYKVV